MVDVTIVRLGVLGSSGMLGSALQRIIGIAEVPDDVAIVPRFLDHDDVEITDGGRVLKAMRGLYEEGVRVVINAIGDTSGKFGPLYRLRVNALGPHIVADGAARASTPDDPMRVIHVSSDCVFSGARRPGRGYHDHEPPSPVDAYGRSKLAGEVDAPHVVNVRTSFIGPEGGLLRWFLDSGDDPVEGYREAYWSGSTSDAIALGLLQIAVDLRDAEAAPRVPSTLHLASEPVAKHDLLLAIAGFTGRSMKRVTPVHHPRVNRVLEPSASLTAPPPIRVALPADMEKWREAGLL